MTEKEEILLLKKQVKKYKFLIIFICLALISFVTVSTIINTINSRKYRQVTSDIANCQAQGLCSKVNDCVVTCYDCNKPPK